MLSVTHLLIILLFYVVRKREHNLRYFLVKSNLKIEVQWRRGVVAGEAAYDRELGRPLPVLRPTQHYIYSVHYKYNVKLQNIIRIIMTLKRLPVGLPKCLTLNDADEE